MSRRFILAVFTLLASVLDFGEAARILAVFPAVSVSHQVVFRKLTLALNKRGHELFVVTPSPVNDPSLKNYTEIDTSIQYNEKDALPNLIELRGKVDWFGFFEVFEPMVTEQVAQIFEHPDLKKLYDPNSGEKFDLILMQMFTYPGLMALAERFKAPMIGIVSASPQTSVQYAIGNPILHSDPSNWQLDMKIPGPPSWIPWKRLDNFIQTWRFIYYHRTVFLPKHQKIAEKYLGNDIPDLHDLEKNISLIFVNQQGPISFARPNVPKVIEIGGFHVTDNIKPLPKDLKKVLDEATQGFIYMSLGSNVKSNMLSEKARNAFITAFSKLPYKVIWKFEDDQLEGKPDNVIILKWAPQQSILAHPNIKLFIYQGGLQSTEEAVSHAVPLIGFPVMSDQDMNLRKMVSVGVAKKLEITKINEDDFLEAIRTVAGDDGYKQRMLNLRSLLKDKPHDILENAIWWTEHVIRHKGAPHLHSTTADEPWYQRQDMDIIAFLTSLFVISLILSLLVFYKCIIYSIRLFSHPTVKKSKKRN
ncbi:UDP-glycosyltransferase UGT5-like [Diprion similis]|uniref:UDP-glycosyltransferase UGT5-like n=1 Tax=Diprion similis TaxID=362088 RepID=UPI001EF80508|nr:UDP-glycosyltransferase UGT5-like [Diprion similis]